MVLFAVSVALAEPTAEAEPAPVEAAEAGAPELEVPAPAPGPAAVVAIGNGLVAGLPARGPVEGAVQPVRMAIPSPAVPGGWVPVLADCLEERAPQRFSVVDRAVSAETLVTARKRVPAVRELAPGFVVVTLGAQELAAGPVAPADLKQLRGQLGDLVSDLLGKGRKAVRPTVLLLSMVPANLVQVGEGAAADEQVDVHQQEVDGRIAAWNDALAQVAKGSDAVVHVNLLADWPREAEARARLTEGGWTLSDQGHARVAAAVCDAILAAARL